MVSAMKETRILGAGGRIKATFPLDVRSDKALLKG